jgi:hypothetical protein
MQVEALAALGAWVERYDACEWDDPPGKLSLLYDRERVIRGGSDPRLIRGIDRSIAACLLLKRVERHQ